MARYVLTGDELRLLTTWLFEASGYLESATRVSDASTASQALEADPDLDVAAWIAAETMTDPPSADEGAMSWWIHENHGVTINREDLPVEAPRWAKVLESWDSSIIAGFTRSPKADRDSQSTRDLCNQDGSVDKTIGSGTHLELQRSIIAKALTVLA